MAKAKKKTKKRKATRRKGKNKGSNFERELCKLFSMWWTNREREDIFWRTSNSGGRATVRSRQGKGTFGQYGDMQATDAIGQPLINVLNIEFKRGYSNDTISGVLDRLPHHAEQQFESFIGQAKTDASKAGCFSWLLVVKRDGKNTMVYMPRKLWRRLNAIKGVNLSHCCPLMKLRGRFRHGDLHTVYAFTLADFFNYLRPKDFKAIDGDLRG